MTFPMMLSDPAFLGLTPQLTPPSGSVMLWRPSQLALNPEDNVLLLPNEGSWGSSADLVPIVSNPKFDVVSGLKCVRYSDGGLNTALRSALFTTTALAQATALFVFRTTATVPSVQYIGDSSVAGLRFGVAVRYDGNPLFGFRGTIRGGNVVSPAISTWHYAIFYSDGTGQGRVDVDGVVGTSGSIGANTNLTRYLVGAADTATTNRFVGQIADVGFWPGDRRTDVDVYARALLGLP